MNAFCDVYKRRSSSWLKWSTSERDIITLRPWGDYTLTGFWAHMRPIFQMFNAGKLTCKQHWFINICSVRFTSLEAKSIPKWITTAEDEPRPVENDVGCFKCWNSLSVNIYSVSALQKWYSKGSERQTGGILHTLWRGHKPEKTYSRSPITSN